MAATTALERFRQLPERQRILDARLALAWLESDEKNRDQFRDLIRFQYGLTPEEFAPHDHRASLLAEEYRTEEAREFARVAIANYLEKLMCP